MPKVLTHRLFPLFFMLTSSCYAADFFETDSILVPLNGPIASLFNLARPDIIHNKTPGSMTLRSQLEITNYISSTIKTRDEFFIDGETLTIRNTLRHQLSATTVISASLPWIKHSGGFSDNFIYTFHDIFHLPQNGRNQNNEDNIQWILNRDGENLVNIDDELSAWGDLSITAQLTPSESPSVRWTFMTKLPTGNYKDHTGSNNVDAGIGFAESNPAWFRDRQFLSSWNLSFWYGASLSYLGDIKKLESLDQNPFVASLRSGVAYSYTPSWHLKCQFDLQSALFDVEIRELGWVPIQISLSTKHFFLEDSSFEFVIIEDIRPRSVPDVIFQTTLETTF